MHEDGDLLNFWMEWLCRNIQASQGSAATYFESRW